MQVSDDKGCALIPRVVEVQGGNVRLSPSDWQGTGEQRTHILDVKTFWLDGGEVTSAEWAECVRRSVCPTGDSAEAGLPVVNVSAEQAETFCRNRGGRLPSEEEWTFAATTEHALRFPWGPHGLVCRRAAYGLVSGPCAWGAVSAELVGSRPAGRSAGGLVDLVGNVAELATRGATWTAMGGSFRSTSAAELRSWSNAPFLGPAADVGFRCAYDHDPSAR